MRLRPSFLAVLTAAVVLVLPSAQAQTVSVTRMDVLQLLVNGDPGASARQGELWGHLPPVPLFLDVPQDHHGAAAIEVAFERGWIDGTADRYFLPDAPLTADAAFVLRLRATPEGWDEVADTRQPLPEESFDRAVRAVLDRGYELYRSYAPGDLLEPGDAWSLFHGVDTGTIVPTGNPAPVVQAQPAIQPDVQPVPEVANADEVGEWTNPSLVAEVETPTPAPVPQPTPQPAYEEPAPMPVPEPEPEPAPAPQEDPMGALPSVRGTDLAQYVSPLPFAITMPTLDIRNLAIGHPSDPGDADSVLEPLRSGVGHLFAYPGGESTVLLYGHSANWPWDVSGFAQIFREINRLEIGDKLYVTHDGLLFVYEVSGHETIPAGSFEGIQREGDGEQLVLYTCWPPETIDERYIVRALLTGIYSAD